MSKIQARNVEIYMGVLDDPTTFSVSGRGNITIAEFMDDSITAGDVTSLTKVSDRDNEFSVEPAEDTVENKLYFGEDSNGSQNSDSFDVTNADVDISLNIDANIVDELVQLGLKKDAITATPYTNYASYNLGVKTTDKFILFIRVKRQVGLNYYYRNILITEPEFKNPAGTLGGASEDTTLTSDFSLLGNKSRSSLDFYSGTTAEVTTNF